MFILRLSYLYVYIELAVNIIQFGEKNGLHKQKSGRTPAFIASEQGKIDLYGYKQRSNAFSSIRNQVITNSPYVKNFDRVIL
jgi:hypothetical protein